MPWGRWPTATITCRVPAPARPARRGKRSRRRSPRWSSTCTPTKPRLTLQASTRPGTQPPHSRVRRARRCCRVLRRCPHRCWPSCCATAPNYDPLHTGRRAGPGYRPSAKLARFVRARDLTCRFPGCTAPAEFCDIDHVIPYPLGATHPSNLACLCRKHHHLKTFWTGDWELQTATRWRRGMDLTDRAHLHHPSGVSKLLPDGTPTPLNFAATAAGAFSTDRGLDDAQAQPHPRRRPRRTHQSRTRTK